jgi:outer membrane protein assembly factor BamE (lipoprotein component of BamABCDE complex)
MNASMAFMAVSRKRLPLHSPAGTAGMQKVVMFWSIMPTLQRIVLISPISKTVTCILGLFTVLLTFDGCFFFRSKPDQKAQEMTSRLSPGMTTDEVLELVGPPQRRGQNLFDKKREYWIYEFVKEPKGTKKRSRSAERNGQETVLESELQLLFERGKLVNWNVVSIKE